MGILPLRIESGHFTGLKVEERVCDLCMNGVEYELHFIFKGPLYEGLRTRIYSSLDTHILTEDADKSNRWYKENTRIIIKFISTAYDIRKSTIFVEK